MSTPHETSFEERATQVFNPLRAQILEETFLNVIDLGEEFKVDYLDDHHAFLKNLLDLLPFGKVLDPPTYYHLTDNVFPQIVDQARRQLLYWHLVQAEHYNHTPVEQFTLFNNDDYLWQRIIPAQTAEIQLSLLDNKRTCFLTRFHLSYNRIEIAFDEIHLLSTSSSDYQLAIADGREHTYTWNEKVWEITLINTDSSIIDPQEFHLPPEPCRPNVLPALDAYIARQAQLERALNQAAETHWASIDSLPNSSSPPDFEESRWDRCICSEEICSCPYRPDTPPTPPSVVLWSPGSKHLPYRA